MAEVPEASIYSMAHGPRHGYFAAMSALDQTRHPTDWLTRAFYPFWAAEHVRYADLDPQGHVNNNAYGVYFEAARVAALTAIYPDFWTQPVTVVLKAIDIEYHAELHYPAQLDLGVAMLRLGTTSFTLALSVFHGDRCCATARSTAVMLDTTTRQPAPIPAVLRQAYETKL